MGFVDKRIVIPRNTRPRYPTMFDDAGDVAPSIKYYQTVEIDIGEYLICDSDADALSKGVQLNETYELSLVNEYGLPPGTLKKRKI